MALDEGAQMAEFPASGGGIGEFASWVRRRLDQARLADSKAVVLAEIALVEAFTNIVRHSGLAGTDRMVSVEALFLGRGVAISLEDPGIPFDPTIALGSMRRGDEEHGMGLGIMAEASGDLHYERRHGKNRLTMVFVPGPEPGL